MIYPPTSGPGSSGSRMRGSGARGGGGGSGSVGASACVKGVRNGRRSGKPKQQQQVVQWKQRNVQEGIVIVDELQLSKLIKRDPIQKFYDLDPEPFATGLFASVRRCRSRDTGQPFAAKFSSRARYGEDCSAEIHHEIALLSLCSPSSRVIRLHDVFETPKEVILVLEFAPGGDMQTIIDDNLVPFEADVVKFVRQLVEGLAYLHERKIAHLDIKPQNLVMMADFPECDVKLCDFEISRVILEGTEIREILGTPDYVAPEILHYEPITLKADMWSLGVTTYVLLTGFSPFGGETDQETFCNISKAEVDFPEELFEDVSKEAQDFIQRLLVRDPGARPTAKECLRHKWLSKKNPRTCTPPTLPVHDPSMLVTKTGTRTSSNDDNSGRVAPRNNSQQQQKNLRKYLSKSREALFERVIQQQQQHQKNSLRKTTLLSQYHKTRRLCESQMSLVSKSRERLLMMDQHQMSPYFSRSREKLYGLRSLSKSHEVLDMCKTGGTVGQEGVGLGILKTLTRATTADLSMIPILRQRLLGHGSSTTSITSSVTTEQDIDEQTVPPSPSEHMKFGRLPTTPSSVIQSPITTNTIEELLEHSSQESLTTTKNEPLMQTPELLSPTLLKETLKNQTNFELFSKTKDENKHVSEINKENVLNLSRFPSESLKEETFVSNISREKERLNEVLGYEENKEIISDETLSKQNIIEREDKLDLQRNNNHLMEDFARQSENETLPKERSSSLPETMTFTIKDLPDTSELTISDNTDSNTVNTEDKKTNRDGGDDDTEPRYTVAQLVSAFNRHQEVVTKTSLEVTMSANDKDIKITPLIFNSENSKFPTGPNALRLFIPDIDITNEPPKRKQKRKYNLGLRYPDKSDQNIATDEASKETTDLSKDTYQTEEDESFQSLESTSSLTGYDCDSLTNVSLPEETNEEKGEEEIENVSLEEGNTQSPLNVTDENADSTNNNSDNSSSTCTLFVEGAVSESVQEDTVTDTENKENDNKFQLSVDVIPSYLRSGSLSSDTSATSSEASSSMSWEELTPPSTATPSSTKDEPQQWPQKATLSPGHRNTSRSRSPSATRDSWGRLCTGTYNRAMEKFTSKISKQEGNKVPTDPNRRPNRKSLTLLSPPQVLSASEKVRRKSIPVIKHYS